MSQPILLKMYGIGRAFHLFPTWAARHLHCGQEMIAWYNGPPYTFSEDRMEYSRRLSRSAADKGPEAAPLAALASLISSPRAIFEFSFYRYVPDTPADERRVVHVAGGIGGMERCLALLDDILPGEELAMHSKVLVDGAAFHIPMIDLACSELGSCGMERLRKFIPSAIMDGMRFFRTGRSFHAYGSELIPADQIHPFWGRALLANPVDGPPVVDARWIGHRMVSGYGSLRLSARQDRSLLAPSPSSPP